MLKYNTYISGSFVLQFLERIVYKNSNMNVYVPDHAPEISSFPYHHHQILYMSLHLMKCEGYQFKPASWNHSNYKLALAGLPSRGYSGNIDSIINVNHPLTPLDWDVANIYKSNGFLSRVYLIDTRGELACTHGYWTGVHVRKLHWGKPRAFEDLTYWLQALPRTNYP